METKFGIVNIGSERLNEEDKQLKNAVDDSKQVTPYKAVTLPWRVLKDDEENRGCVRDMTLLFSKST